MFDRKPRTVLTAACLAALAGPPLSLTAAGASPGHGQTAFGEPGEASAVDRTVRLAVDGMSYGADRLEVKAGETVRFVIENGSAIVHDFTIGDATTQAAHRREMTAMMGEPDGGMAHDDANAVLLEPGATGEIIWTFSEPGSFEFACNVPGHYQAGMKGTLAVVRDGS